MVPGPIIDFAIEGERSANTVVIAREELDVFRVFSILKSVCAAAGARKLARFDIDGHPLEALPAQYFQCSPVAKGHLADLVALLSASDTPNARHGPLIGINALPRCVAAR